MRLRRMRTLALGTGLAITLAVGGAAAHAAETQNGVQVLHGATAAAEEYKAISTEGGVKVIRPKGNLREPASPTGLQPIDYRQPPSYTVVAGERLWLVDVERGEFVICRTGLSTMVGQLPIRCTRQDLPR